MKFHFLCSRRAILQNDDILSSSPISNLFINDFWGTPLSHSGSHKSYRPLCSLTFRLNALISGLNPYSFHLVNVSLHAISTYLVAAFAKTVFSRKSTVFLAPLIFALHPIHTGTTWDSFAVLPAYKCFQSWLHWQFSLHKINIEVFSLTRILMPYFNFSEAVAGVVGRADILAAVFFLLALLAFSKHLQIRDKRPSSVTSAFANKTNHPNDYECDRNGNFAAASKNFAVYRKGQQSLSSSSTFLVLEPYLLLTVIFAACAMFSKEQGITVLGNHLYIF